MSLSAIEYKSGDEMRRAAAALHKRLWSVVKQKPKPQPVIERVSYGRDMGCQHNRHMVDYAYHRMMKEYENATVEFALPSLAKGYQTPGIERIVEACSLHFEVPISDIHSHRRTYKTTNARQVATYIAKELTRFSVSEISRRIGDRDHTSGLWSIKVVKAKMEKDNEFRRTVEALKHSIMEGNG